MALVVEPSLFAGKHNAPGDFEWMRRQPEYADALFIYLENVIDMLMSDDAGGGSACMRKHAYYATLTEQDKCAVGIPTGWSKETGGFATLNDITRAIIDRAIARVVKVLQQIKYRRVIYPCDEAKPELIGSRIFKGSISDCVVKYISHCINSLPMTVEHYRPPTLRMLIADDLRLLGMALLIQKAGQANFEWSTRAQKRQAPWPAEPLASRPVRQSTLFGAFGKK